MCALRRVKPDYKDDPAHAESCAQCTWCIKNGILQQLKDKEMRTGEKKKKKEKESGKCRPPGTQQQFIQPDCWLLGTSSSLEYVPVMIKKMCHMEVEEK